MLTSKMVRQKNESGIPWSKQDRNFTMQKRYGQAPCSCHCSTTPYSKQLTWGTVYWTKKRPHHYWIGSPRPQSISISMIIMPLGVVSYSSRADWQEEEEECPSGNLGTGWASTYAPHQGMRDQYPWYLTCRRQWCRPSSTSVTTTYLRRDALPPTLHWCTLIGSPLRGLQKHKQHVRKSKRTLPKRVECPNAFIIRNAPAPPSEEIGK